MTLILVLGMPSLVMSHEQTLNTKSTKFSNQISLLTHITPLPPVRPLELRKKYVYLSMLRQNTKNMLSRNTPISSPPIFFWMTTGNGF